MMEAVHARWRAFDGLGVEEVRKQLAANVFGEEKAAQARQWLEHQESERTFEVSRKALAASEQAVEEAHTANALSREANDAAHAANSLAREAVDKARAANSTARQSNDLARSANAIAAEAAASACRTAEAARNNNMIATLALIAAIVAMAISIIGMFIKAH